MLQALRDLSHAANYRIARDTTGDVAHRSALVLAPHPDDETLGCGATILRKVAAGTPVTIAVLSDGSAVHNGAHLTREQTAVLRHAETVETVEAVRRLGLPTKVYVTGALEPRPDHSALGRAARRAARATGTPLLEYPIWLWTASPVAFGVRTDAVARATLPMLLCRRVRKVRADAYLDAKCHAIAAHDSQLDRPPTVPPRVAWSPLPREILSQARRPAELFLPWPR